MPKRVAVCKKEEQPPELAYDGKFPLRSGRSRITSEVLDKLVSGKALKVTQEKENQKK